jgi:glutamine amidotransferase/cyclase
VKRFDVDLAVPHIGWNGIRVKQPTDLFHGLDGDEKFYFVHSYHAVADDPAVVLTTTDYGYPFVSAVQQKNIQGTQFHPEKSGASGLTVLENFIRKDRQVTIPKKTPPQTRLAKRIIACLDVRANDQGDLVVTKGDQYDVREAGNVRNLGKPVELAQRYFEEGADEVTFLNITGFRDFPSKTCP